MARPRTHRNPGRRPPGLYAAAEPPAAEEASSATEDEAELRQAAEQEAAAAAAQQQVTAEATASGGGPAAAAAAGDPALLHPLPHIAPNHRTRGQRPSSLVLPTDVHLSIDGTPLPAPASSVAAATSASVDGAAAAAAAAAGGEAAVALPGGRLPPGDISFHTVCAFASSIAKLKGKGCIERKRRRVVKFMEEVVARESGEAWAIWRLLLPHLDNQRGPYNLKERALGSVLIQVCSLADDSVEANKIRHWIKPGKKGAGDFARVLLENVFRVYCLSDASREKELKVREVNAELDALAAAALLRGSEATERRCLIMRRLLTRCNPDMAFYLAQIILRELRVNLSHEYVFKWWHPDAQQLYNCTTSAAAVFNTLTDPGKRISPTVAPGRPAAPQLSMPLHSTEAVVEMMRRQREEAGGELSFLIEPKLDGERQQVHILGPDQPCQYWSRSGINHGQLRNANTPGPPGGFCLFDSVLRQQVIPQRCILDGELLVWNKKRHNFEIFGSLRSTILAGHANEDPHFRVDCEDFDGNINTADPEWESPCLGDLEVVYLPWDVLFLDGRCVCHLPVLERRELLRRALREAPPEGYPLSPNGVLRGRVVPMLPGQPLLGTVAAPCLCSTSEDVLEAVKGAIRRHEEGIVVKSLPSQWLPGDRNGQWVKIKPDYLSRVEIDALIIGCFWGEDRRAGLFSEFLLAIAAPPPAGKAAPERWISFCKVGSGFTDLDRERLHNALKDNVCEHPPPCYEITAHSKERPHYWIQDPLKSVVLEVQADLRLIKSRIYAAEYSLRFPRMERIRESWDKDALSCTTATELQDFVAERKGNLARDDAKQLRSPGKAGPRKARQAAKRRPKGHKLPKAIAGVDVGQVVAESSALDGCWVCVLNYEGFDALQCRELILKQGGRPWELYSPGCDKISHVLAGAPGKGTSWRAAAKAGCDILSLAWLQRCAAAGQRLEPRPGEFLQLSAATLQSRPDWDCWGDSLFEEATADDVAALLRRMPDAASLAQVMERQDQAQEPQRQQRQHPWERRRQGQQQQQQTAERQQEENSGSEVGEQPGAGTLLGGCRVALACLPAPQEAPVVTGSAQLAGLQQMRVATTRSSHVLAQCRAACCRGLVAALGGTCSNRVDEATTHLLVIQPEEAPCCASTPAASSGSASSSDGCSGGSGSAAPSAAMSVQPEVLLAAVSEQCGGAAAVASLQRRLQSGALLVLPHRRLQDLAAAVEDLPTGVQPPRLEGGVGLPMAAGCSDWTAWPWQQFTEADGKHAATAAAAVEPAVAAAAAAAAGSAEPAQGGPALAATQAAARRAGAPGRGPAARDKPSGGQRAAAGRRGAAASRGSSPGVEAAVPAKLAGNGQRAQAMQRAAVAGLLAELPSQLPASQPAAAADYAWPASQPAAAAADFAWPASQAAAPAEFALPASQPAMPTAPGAARPSGPRRGGRAVRKAPAVVAASQPAGLTAVEAAAAAPAAARVRSRPAVAAAIQPAAAAASQPLGEPDMVDLAGSSDDDGPAQPAAKRCKSASPSAAHHPGPPTLAAAEAPAAISGRGGGHGGPAAPPAPPSMFAVLCSRWNLSGAAGTAGAAAGSAAAGASCAAGAAGAAGAVGAAGAACTASAARTAVAARGIGGFEAPHASQPAPVAAAEVGPVAAAAAPLPPGNTLAMLLGLPADHFATQPAPAPAPSQPAPAASQPVPAAAQAPVPAAAPEDTQGNGGAAAEEEGDLLGRRNRLSRMRAKFLASQDGSQLYKPLD